MKARVRKEFHETVIDFEVEANGLKDCLEKVALVSATPTVCGNCSEKDVSVQAQRNKEYLFIKVKCHSCKWESQLGERKDGKGFWWKEWEAPYEGGGSQIDTSEMDF